MFIMIVCFMFVVYVVFWVFGGDDLFTCCIVVGLAIVGVLVIYFVWVVVEKWCGIYL